MFWRGALPGFNFKMDSDADVTTIDTDDLKDQIEKYIHGLQRTLRTQGMEVQSIAPQVSSPKDHVDVQMMLISATTGIPRRILEGSERGELASSQDENNWLSRIDIRRTQYVQPMILRVFIQKLIDVGVLPDPGEDGFTITWPSLFSPSAKDRAEVGLKKAETLGKYVGSPGADMVIPVEVFLRDFMEYAEDQIQEITMMIKKMMADREKEEDEEERLLEEEENQEEEEE